MSTRPSGSFLTQGTWTLYRLSPLHYAGSPALLSDDALQLHSRRLTDALKGNLLHGVPISLDNVSDGTIAYGLLRNCRWSVLAAKEASMDGDEFATQGSTGLYGIKVDIQYEKNTFVALILGSSTTTEAQTLSTVRLPLLMTRMPSASRERLLSYLAIAFDTRIEPMRVSGELMGRMLDDYFEGCLRSSTSGFENTVKPVQLTLGFNQLVAQGLKSVSIDIRREDVLEFIKKGRASAGAVSKQMTGPFMTAMRQYLLEQTSMDITHDNVDLIRVSCGGFIISGDGKLKILTLHALDTAEDDNADSQLSLTITIPVTQALLASAEARIGWGDTGQCD